MVMFMLTALKWEDEDEFDFAMMLNEHSKMINRAFNGKNFRKAVKTWLPFLDKQGFLDPIAVDGKVHEE